jgi:radical SAM-linked protein
MKGRVRIRFTKLGKIRWTSHRDVARMWERAFRRAQLPVAYSEGFSPRPRVSFGLALPTGYESVAEYLDVELSDLQQVDVASLPSRLSPALPVGVDATAASEIAPGTPSLQEDVATCSWRWVASPSSEDGNAALHRLGDRVADVLEARSVVVTRNRKGVEVTEDIRGGILGLKMIGPEGADASHGWWLEAELACHPRSLRPTEVLLALGPGLEERIVRRTHQWILRDGARREPLLAGSDLAMDAPHVVGRAS